MAVCLSSYLDAPVYSQQGIYMHVDYMYAHVQSCKCMHVDSMYTHAYVSACMWITFTHMHRSVHACGLHVHTHVMFRHVEAHNMVASKGATECTREMVHSCTVM